MFLPGSQISDKPLKDIFILNEPQKFALIKLDRIRGNACFREIISSQKEDKEIVDKYKVETLLKVLR